MLSNIDMDNLSQYNIDFCTDKGREPPSANIFNKFIINLNQDDELEVECCGDKIDVSR